MTNLKNPIYLWDSSASCDSCDSTDRRDSSDSCDDSDSSDSSDISDIFVPPKNCDKTQKLKLWQNLKTQNVTKFKNSNCDKTREFK